MNYNYRVIKSEYKSMPGHFGYEIHEVYYNEKGQIDSWSDSGISPYGESVLDLKDDLLKMLAAFDKPILERVEDGEVDIVRAEE